MQGCGLSLLDTYKTPIGDIKLDTNSKHPFTSPFNQYSLAIQELLATKIFNQTTQKIEEDEHSLEMHLPFIRKAF